MQIRTTAMIFALLFTVAACAPAEYNVTEQVAATPTPTATPAPKVPQPPQPPACMAEKATIEQLEKQLETAQARIKELEIDLWACERVRCKHRHDD